jgi:MinD superfamily P-loop ATPase
MKELVVISGKGGTGKTSLTAAFASLAKNMVLCDADVDAADLHLLMAPEIIEKHDFQGGNQAVINRGKCIECGLCRDLCNWKAIDKDYMVSPIDCEGCGVCVYFCPEKAIEFPVKTCGEWYISATRFGPMVHARLGIAEENSGRLVSLVRQQTKRLAEEKGLDLILTDGPPGIGCPVIASLGGATAVLIVVEPTLSGKHDMTRVAELAGHFKVPAMMCVNKFDLNVDETKVIEDTARKNNMEVLARIPFDPIFTKAMVQGQTIFEYDPRSEACEGVKKIWERIAENLQV